MIGVIILNILIAAMLARAVYQLALYITEYSSLSGDIPRVECQLVRDHLEEWIETVIAKLCWQLGALVLLFYGDFEGDPFEAVDLIVPLFILGVIAMIVRAERGIHLDKQRAKMWREELNGGRPEEFNPPDELRGER